MSLELDKITDADYLERVKEWNSSQKGSTNAVKIVNAAILSAVKDKAKALNVKKLGDLEAAKITLETLKAQQLKIEKLVKELEAAEKAKAEKASFEVKEQADENEDLLN